MCSVTHHGFSNFSKGSLILDGSILVVHGGIPMRYDFSFQNIEEKSVTTFLVSFTYLLLYFSNSSSSSSQ
ncbi:hypothetical protein RJT34_04170 [Clitoria ternatea]|uniref:Uncharacterized protein n=1 Tax=Clitoria ternatea TaxID=43366 RepID=A0AAN9KP87_CLITE